MSNDTLADQALANLKKMTECLQAAETVLKEHQAAILDLKTIAKFQQERIDLQNQAIKALQAMLRNLDERLKGERSFAV